MVAKGGKDLVYSAADLPEGLRIDEAKGEISGTPKEAKESKVKVTVSDAAASAEATVTFTWAIAKPKSGGGGDGALAKETAAGKTS